MHLRSGLGLPYGWRFGLILERLAEEAKQALASGGADVAQSVEMARLRRCVDSAHGLYRQGCLQGSASVAATLAQPGNWAEHPPPRVNPETVATMQETFKANYPGERLTRPPQPSTRAADQVDPLAVLFFWLIVSRLYGSQEEFQAPWD